MLPDLALAQAGIDNVAVIEATLAPIFLLTGTALFMNFVQARLFRVVDRLLGNGGAGEMTERERIVRQDRRRLVVLRNAVLFGVLDVAFTVLTILVLLVPSAFPGTSVGTLPIWTFAAALVSLAIALALVVVDAFASARAARRLSSDPERAARRASDA